MVEGRGGRGHVLDLVEDFKHVLVGLLQSQLFGNLVQRQVDVALERADLLEALVEIEGVFLANLEEEGDLAAL